MARSKEEAREYFTQPIEGIKIIRNGEELTIEAARFNAFGRPSVVTDRGTIRGK